MACGPCNRGDHADCLGRGRWCDCGCEGPTYGETGAYPYGPLKPILKIKCWCGLWSTVAEDSHGGMSVLHQTPACQRFLEEPIDEYLHNLRVHYEQ